MRIVVMEIEIKVDIYLAHVNLISLLIHLFISLT